MKILLAGQMTRSGTDYLVPVAIKVFLHRTRYTNLFVTGQVENTNVVAEDGLFVNTEVRNWAVSLVNQAILKRRVRRQAWEK